MRKLTFLVYLIMAILSFIVGYGSDISASPDSQSKIVWELFRDEDYIGPVQQGSVDAKGTITYLATRTVLYGVQLVDEKPRVWPVAERPEKDARLVFAPGGTIFAWQIPRSSWQGLFYARLVEISDKQIHYLWLPHGFSTLHLGFQGKIIVTASPLDEREGIRGRFQYTFWSRKGKILKEVVLDTRHQAVLDPAGEAILLMGDKQAMAYSPSGKELWPAPLEGKFRKAAIAKGGNLALLNPFSSEKIDRVVIFKKKSLPFLRTNPFERAEVQAPTPVHRLTLSADGSSAVVIGDLGRYFHLDLSKANLREGQRLPLEGTFYIFNSEFIDSKTLALGVQHRVGEPPKTTWPKATIIIIDRNGNALDQKEFQIRDATSFIPGIDVTFGSRFIVGYTQDTVILLELIEQK
jgi:hypothetical protein